MSSPDRHLTDAVPGELPRHEDVQQLIEAERGLGPQGVLRTWRASNSSRVVLTSDAAGVKISRNDGSSPPAQVIVDGTTAAGHLTGTYPNPTIATSAPVVFDGDAAGGALAGTYPNPSLAPATVAALMDQICPPGTVVPYAASGSLPAGWLYANGASVSTTTYAKLFAVIGYTYGGGGGSFNLPNLFGRFVLGASGSHAVGSVGGAETVASPAHAHPGTHSHGLNSHTHTSATHNHSLVSTHTHGMTNHDHTLNGHSHNATALGVGGSTGAASGTGLLYAAGGANATTVGHTHDNGSLDVTGNTDGATGNTSGATNYTDGVGQTGTASNNTTISETPGATGPPSTGLTATDATAPGADYVAAGTSTIAVMPPFLSMQFIIRAG